MSRTLLMTVAILLAVVHAAAAQDDQEEKIKDNSFFIDEAYNQERGKVQHIQSFHLRKGGEWQYTFTQEWPVPNEKHQVSYIIPVQRVTDPERHTGVSDVQLSYRYQAVQNERVAAAPRFALVLPTGDYKKGLGKGNVGYEVLFPVSAELSDKVVTHWNLGWVFTPDSRNEAGDRADTVDTIFGASIVYLAAPKFNLLLEAFGIAGQKVVGPGETESENTMLINPGVRFAIDVGKKLQIVPGVSFPIGIGPSKGEYGVFTYLSFEHDFF